MRNLHLIVFTLFSFPLLLAMAEDPPTSVKFRTFALQGTVDGIYVRSGTKDIPVRARSYSRSVEFDADLIDGQHFYFYRILETDEGLQRKPIAKVNALAAKAPLLVLMYWVGDVLHVLPQSDSITDFPGGSYRILNLSSSGIVAAFGAEKFQLPSGATRTVNLKKVAEDGVVQIDMATLTDPPVLFYSRPSRVDEDSRRLVLASDTGIRTRPVRLKFISERAMDTEPVVEE